MSFFEKIAQGLTKTKDTLMQGVEQVLQTFVKIDEELFEELEDTLIMADIGVETSAFIIDNLRDRVKKDRLTEAADVRAIIKEEIATILIEDHKEFSPSHPTIILVVGVNGVGKTTTIGKLAKHFKDQGKKVILAAADTFRAAAIDQLEVWAGRTSVDIIKHQANADPSAVVYDALNAAKARKSDVLIIDTAGRLHNKKNLMEELKKINRVIGREYPQANVEALLVLDANTGQNALQQAKAFSQVTDVTGIILTKLDSTAKGGIVVAITHHLKIPIYFVGVGEGIDDLLPFNAEDFAQALFD
ncbi:MAG: signal recognition particle-docking protein FtsY [Defluviitaleaceae bacterium]|nr:signal recognition particle-docking protein FtsY [Defluviitaleaceae bacterium]